MIPSITTYTRKVGTNRKHRYYVCGNFHNKGSSACKANSIKAYEAEEWNVNNKLDKKLKGLYSNFYRCYIPKCSVNPKVH